jgi:hypothetical protein
MRKIVFLLLLVSTAHAAGPSVLEDTTHVIGDIVTAITTVGGTVGSGGSLVDSTCASNGTGFNGVAPCGATGSFVFPPSVFVPYAINTGNNYFNSSALTVPVNHAPYTLMSESSQGWGLNLVDQQNYTALQANGILFNMAYCGAPVAGDYPPVASSTILPSSSSIPAYSGTAWNCAYAPGIEFSMTLGYKGLDTASPSGTTASMTGLFAALKQAHPTWTWNDIKAAFRQTADGWSTGYAALHSSPLGFGYGNINYDAANALASSSSIFLQAPGMTAVNYGYYVMVILYPFMQTRRSREVVYVGGTWPAPNTGNELTAAQIAGASGTKIFDNAGATGIQGFSYSPSVSGSTVLTALTLDSSGNGSRVESFSQIAETFLLGTACLDD